MNTPTRSSTPVDIETPLRLDEWINNDHYLLTKMHSVVTEQFRPLHQLLNCYIWLDSWLDISPVFFVPNLRINLLSTFQVYDIRVGNLQGIRIGHVFRTPLNVKLDRTYMLAYRSTFDAEAELLEQTPGLRKYCIGKLIYFTVKDEAILVTSVPNTDFIRNLDN